MLDQQGDLAIAELVYWGPATVLAIVICFRHGWGRQLGWFLIVLLGLARLIGASCTVAEEQQQKPNYSLLAAAAICNSIGLSFLISVLIGLLNRIADGTKVPMLPPRILRLLQIVMLVGIILSAVGGSDLASGGNDVAEGKKLLKAGVILFTVGLAATTAGLILATFNLRKVPSGERRLVFACWLCLPFVTVRLVYSLISIFGNLPGFSYYNPNIWVRAFMAVAMEFIVATIIITVGFLTQVIPRGHVQQGNEQGEYYTQSQSKQESGYVPSTQPATVSDQRYYASGRGQP